MNQEQIVLEDASGNYWPGALIPGPSAPAMRAKGVAMMPVAADLLPAPAGMPRARRNAVLGFFRRDYGAGWQLKPTPEIVCPMVLYVVPGYPVIHWRARIVAPTAAAAQAQRRGQLRICTDSMQSGAGAFGLTIPSGQHVELGALGPADDVGGWVVGGKASLHATLEGYAGISLWGSCTNGDLRIAWAAVSATKF